jgi:phosphoglycerate kinase
MSIKLNAINAHDVAGKTVLVRVDYNVPLKKNGDIWEITNDERIQASLETIKLLLANKAQIILMSHLGRPDGKVNPDFSLAPIAKHLGKLLGESVELIENYWPAKDSQLVSRNSNIVLLENLRFYPEEEANDEKFAQFLASLADIYVNEAFSASHRAHASTEGVTHFLPSYAGLALINEVTNLGQLMDKPRRPFVMVVGGAKISDKVDAVVNLTKIADVVLVGGGVANNFLKAEGVNIAGSYVQDAPADAKKKGVDYVQTAAELLDDTENDRLLLTDQVRVPKIIPPIDVLTGESPEAQTSEVVELYHDLTPDQLVKSDMFLDIGPKTIAIFKKIIAEAGTIFWNGPMGVFENQTFAQGTKTIAEAIANSSAQTILGGGDTLTAIDKFNLKDKYTYVSAAGGASLEFLSGKMLPGIKPLLSADDIK